MHDELDQLKVAGIFGMKQSGKTTLAKKLSRYWQVRGRTSLVLDPVGDFAGIKNVLAFPMDKEELFFEECWKRNGCLVIIEEAASTIRRDRDLIPVFTRLHHNNHKIVVIGHGGADLLPTMRRQLDQIFLFRQNTDEAKEWANEFCREAMLESMRLEQYEFLWCKRFGDPKKYKGTK
jgi:hypothetical protein